MAARVGVLWMCVVFACFEKLCESTTPGGDYDLSVILAADTDDGVVITWKSSTGRPEGKRHATVGNHDFPRECGLSKGINRCNILTLSHPLSLSHTFVMLSVEDGIFALKLDSSESDSLLTDPEGFLITWSDMGSPPDCQTTALSEGLIQPIVVCVNYGFSSITVSFLEIQLNVHNLSSSEIDTRPLDILTLTADNLTSFISDADTFCLGGDVDNILFATDYTLRLFSTTKRVADPVGDLNENCRFAKDLGYFGGNTVLAYCPDQIAERVDVCTGESVMVFNQSTTGIPVPCSSWDIQAHRRNDSISVPPSTDGSFLGANFTFDEPIQHALCISGENDTYVVVLLENTTVIAVEVTTEEQYTLAKRSCDNDTWCYTPNVWGDRYLGYTNGTHFLVNDLYCLVNPEILAVEFIPHSVELLIGPSPPEVQCVRTPPTTSVTEVQSTSTPMNLHSSSFTPAHSSFTPTQVVRTSAIIAPVSTIHLTPSSTPVTVPVSTTQPIPETPEITPTLVVTETPPVVIDPPGGQSSTVSNDLILSAFIVGPVLSVFTFVVVGVACVLWAVQHFGIYSINTRGRQRLTTSPPIPNNTRTPSPNGETSFTQSREQSGDTTTREQSGDTTTIDIEVVDVAQNGPANILSDSQDTDQLPTSPTSQQTAGHGAHNGVTLGSQPTSPLASPLANSTFHSHIETSFIQPQEQPGCITNETAEFSFISQNPSDANLSSASQSVDYKEQPTSASHQQATGCSVSTNSTETILSPLLGSSGHADDDDIVKLKPLPASPVAGQYFIDENKENTTRPVSEASTPPDMPSAYTQHQSQYPSGLTGVTSSMPSNTNNVHERQFPLGDHADAHNINHEPPAPSSPVNQQPSRPPGLYGYQSEEVIVLPVLEATPNAQPRQTDTTVVGTFPLVPHHTLSPDPQDQARRQLRPEDD